MSHTKAPWTRAGNLIVGHAGAPVCIMSSPSLFVGSLSEYAGNADLVAAAPDMLAMLKTLAESECAGCGSFHDGEHYQGCGLEALIAKAEGR